jgi:hypothetical protein
MDNGLNNMNSLKKLLLVKLLQRSEWNNAPVCHLRMKCSESGRFLTGSDFQNPDSDPDLSIFSAKCLGFVLERKYAEKSIYS